MTKRILTLPAIALPLILLTACGGSGGGGEVAIVDELKIEFTQFEPLANDDNRFASTEPIDTTDSVTAHGNGIRAIFAGEDYIFTGGSDAAGFISNSDSNNDGARIRFADSLMSSYLDLGTVGWVAGGEHTDIQGTFYNLVPSDDSLGFLKGYGVAGVRTPSAAIGAQKATATYRGILELQKYLGSSSANDIQQRVLTMRVDFGAGMISGESTDSNGTITFNETSISGDTDGGAFNGTLSLDNAGEVLGISAGTATGSYAGIFFGSAADDVAGVVRINATDGEATVLAIGGFRADND